MSKDNKYNEIEQAVISYGLELLLNSVLKTCIYMLIGIVSGKGLEVACSLVGFICIRKFSGGCHATTNTVCFVLTGGIVLGAAYSPNLISISLQCYKMLFAIICTIFIFLAPCDECFEEKENYKEKIQAKIVSLLIVNVFFVIGMYAGQYWRMIILTTRRMQLRHG